MAVPLSQRSSCTLTGHWWYNVALVMVTGSQHKLHHATGRSTPGPQDVERPDAGRRDMAPLSSQPTIADPDACVSADGCPPTGVFQRDSGLLTLPVPGATTSTPALPLLELPCEYVAERIGVQDVCRYSADPHLTPAPSPGGSLLASGLHLTENDLDRVGHVRRSVTPTTNALFQAVRSCSGSRALPWSATRLCAQQRAGRYGCRLRLCRLARPL